MKKILLLSCLAISILISCNSNDTSKEKQETEKTDTVTTIQNSPDSMKTIVNPSIVWTVDDETEGTEKLKKPQEKLDTFTTAKLVELLNENYPDIKLNLIKVSHDTIYVTIPESTRLTQGIGDSGAQNYLASVTYTLTETKNIKFINIKFKAGDHAEPGVYSRSDFKDLQ